MSTRSRPLIIPRAETPEARWARYRDVPIAILAWTGVVAVILWSAAHIVRALLLLAIAGLLAYALAPAIKLLQRVMPRALAIFIVYIVVLSGLSFLCYQIVSTALLERFRLAQYIEVLLQPSPTRPPTGLDETL